MLSKFNPNYTDTKFGFVAIIGAPNAGKSTLTNALCGRKISIVTPKAQTTRTRVRAICMLDKAQVVLIDTPGVFKNTGRRLDRAMVGAAWVGAENADSLLVLVDVSKPWNLNNELIFRELSKRGRKAILVLNKIDTVAKADLLKLSAVMDKKGIFSDTFMVSAKIGDGLQDLARHITSIMPNGAWHYPSDQLADISERFLAAELVREQVFIQLEKELPYSITVETERWEKQRDGSLRVQLIIFVRRDTQKAIVLGKGGGRVKRIGSAARAELATALGCAVHLLLFVKVRKDWPEDPQRYKEMGLDFNV